jgi:tetratricopeptide (TPR) repeat protein
LTLWAYSGVTRMGYVLWDDNVTVQDNALLRLPWWEATRAMFGGFYSGDYMPLTLQSYWLELHLFGFGPGEQHGVNLALHLLNTALLAAWLQAVPRLRRWTPLLCAVFALHPVQVESVAWLSERKGLLASAFYFAAIWAALRASVADRHRWIYRGLYGGLFLCAALAKANGLLLPVWLFAVALNEASEQRPAERRRSILVLHLPVLVLAICFAWVRTKAYASSIPSLGSAVFDPVHLRALPEQIAAGIGFYARTLLWPKDLSIIYPPFNPGGPWQLDAALGGLLMLLGVACVALRSLRDASLGLLFAAVTLLPVLQLVPRLNFVNDRYLYLPIIGATAWVLLALEALGSRFASKLSGAWLHQAGPMVLAALFMACGSVSSTRRLTVWTSNLALWSDTVAKIPGSSLAHNNLGQALLDQGERTAAIRAFEASLAVAAATPTGDNSALNNLAMIHSDASHPETFDLQKAANYLHQGIAMAPRPEEAFIPRFNLALVYLQAGQPAVTLDHLQRLERDLDRSPNQHYRFLQERIQSMLPKLQASPPVPP